MDKRPIGRSGLNIAPLMLGASVFGWTADEAASFSVLDAFVDAGFDAIDTADVYSRWVPGHAGGESEAIIGRWLTARGGRDRVILATKLGTDMGGGRKGLSRAYMMKAVEDSLKRLQTDYIDLYQSHGDDADTPLEESAEAFGRLVEQGKVRVVGASNHGWPRLAEALAVSAAKGLPRYECLQPRYNLADRASFEGGLQDLCVAEDIGVIPFAGLASGFLTGKYRSQADLAKSHRGGRVERNLNARGLGILEALDAVAGAHEATPAQVSLAWLMAQPGVTAPIASATSRTQLDDILGAARLRLTGEAIRMLTDASAETSVNQ